VGTGYTLRATSAGLTDAVTGTFNITPAAAASVAWNVQPTDVVASASITPSPTVRVLDAFGNLATGSTAAVTVSILANPGGGTLGGTLVHNAVAGVATFPGLSVNMVGTGYTLSAAASGLGTSTSAAFDVTVGAPAQVAFTVQPTTTRVGTAIAPPVQVAVQDADGNTVPSATNLVTLTIGANPGGGTLSGALAVAAVAGVATFPGLSLNSVATGYTLTADASGLSGDESAAFMVTGVPARKVAARFVTTAPVVDFGADASALPDLDFNLRNGAAVVAEACARRLQTVRGTLAFHPDYGTDPRAYLKDKITSAKLHEIQAAVEAECEKDPRVQAASCSASYDTDTRALSISASLTTAAGPFDLVGTVDAAEANFNTSGAL
jgi:phage baseplate assembly protein W